jgi:uncharacterized membrane protein
MATATMPAGGDTLAEPTPKGLTRSGAARLDAIDMLRGLVIAIMALDHTRDFFHFYAQRFDPTDPAKTWPLLFATRWVTHLCAPTFVFLAGVSIYFQKANGKTDLSSFLLKRGLWLILLECTVVSFGFNFGEPFISLQVIWAIGASMIAMSVIARLPARSVLALGLAILLLYPFAVSATSGAQGVRGIVRMLALAPGMIPGMPIRVRYAALPWLAIMCLGFGLGSIFRLPQAERRLRLLQLASGLLLLFLTLRLLDGYGDPVPWSIQTTPTRTFLSFMNVSKYPPSPDYAFATLGISMLLFLILEAVRGPVAKVLLAYGRTSLFTYVCHLYILHFLMIAAVLATGFPFSVATHVVYLSSVVQANWGFSLVIVYFVWALTLALLIPLSMWFSALKARRRDWWLSYL